MKLLTNEEISNLTRPDINRTKFYAEVVKLQAQAKLANTQLSIIKRAEKLIDTIAPRLTHTLDCLNYADPKECECDVEDLEEESRSLLSDIKELKEEG